MARNSEFGVELGSIVGGGEATGSGDQERAIGLEAVGGARQQCPGLCLLKRKAESP